MNDCSNCGPGGRQKRKLCDLCYGRLGAHEPAHGQWAPQSALVPAELVREHVRSLSVAGVSIRQLSTLSGVSRTAIVVLMRGKTGGEVREHVWRSTADRLLTVPVPETPRAGTIRTDLVPSIGSARRLQALVAAGWTQTDLAGRLGIASGNLYPVVHGHRRYLTVRRVRQVLELWAELRLVAGPSNAARRYGADMRWPLPLQWDGADLDDPAAVPTASLQQAAVRSANRDRRINAGCRLHPAQLEVPEVRP